MTSLSISEVWAKIPETRAETEEHVRTISAMLDSGGWKIFEAQIGRVEAWLAGVAIDSPNPDHRTQAAGAVKQLRVMKTWPIDHAKASQEALANPDFVFPDDEGYLTEQ